MSQLAWSFDASLAEVGRARSVAGAALAGWGVPPDDVVLVVSELAANAVRHADGGFELSLRCVDDPSTVTVEVADSSSVIPQAHEPGPGTVGGRGLLIIDRLARAWGVRSVRGGGKIVWAEVPTA